jgi:hypothetical protein
MLPGCGCAKPSIAGENCYISVHFVATGANTATVWDNDPQSVHIQQRNCVVARSQYVTIALLRLLVTFISKVGADPKSLHFVQH